MIGVFGRIHGLTRKFHRPLCQETKVYFARAAGPSGLEGDVRDAFERMRREDVPLFSSCDDFLKSLPTREVKGNVLKLYTLPYYVRPEHVERMALELEAMKEDEDVLPDSLADTQDVLEKNEIADRIGVPYVAAPRGRGKSACVLPAFLNSERSDRPAKFTHYVYIAFDNNDDRCFSSSQGKWSRENEPPEVVAESYMAKCLKFSLDNAFEPDSNFAELLPFGTLGVKLEDEDTSKAELIKFMKWWNTTFSEDEKFLVHIDEHRKMFEDTYLDEQTQHQLRRRAITWLAQLPRTSVVLSYTDVPNIPAGSSPVCRKAIAVPPIDVSAIIDAHPELSLLQWKDGPEDERRKIATLRFRLAARIYYSPVNLHYSRVRYWNQYLKKFDSAKTLTSEADREKALMQLTKVPLKSVKSGKELLMILEDKEEEQKERYPEVVTLSDGRLACAWQEILTTTSPSAVYWDGLIRMRKMLTSTDSTDIFSDKPLEAMYAWTLSAKSHKEGYLVLKKWRFIIKCKKIKYGRIFPTTNTSNIFPNLTTVLEEDILYLADEDKEEGKPMHPKGDIFFRTNDNELVVIDVMGTKSEEKIIKKVEGLHRMKPLVESQGIDCYGVVLAPNAEVVNYSCGQNIAIAGKEAKNLMGGLVQLLSWLQ